MSTRQKIMALLFQLTILAFAFAQSASAEDWYVTTNGTGNGSSWASPTNSINGAISVIAASITNTVWVSNGVYETGGTVVPGYSLTNRVYINKIITVRSANNDPANTIIKGAWDPATTNGPAAVRCVYIVDDAALIGFTLTNGATTNGVTSTNPDGYGGGLLGTSGRRASVSNCIITGNSSSGDGCGAYYATLYNCKLIGNKPVTLSTQASGGGGAFKCNLYNCIVSGNSARNGGGAWCGNLYNCLVAGNTVLYAGGGVRVQDNVSGIYNCTIVGNMAGVGQPGGGIYCEIGFTMKVYNCIVYSNDAAYDKNWNNNDTCFIFSNTCTTPIYYTWAPSNITNNPLFVTYGVGYGTNLVGGNYRLRVDSPCVNAGINGSWLTNCPTDLDGHSRIDRFSGIVDMGAYEHLPSGTIFRGF